LVYIEAKLSSVKERKIEREYMTTLIEPKAALLPLLLMDTGVIVFAKLFFSTVEACVAAKKKKELYQSA
jgi:hypothetical protein